MKTPAATSLPPLLRLLLPALLALTCHAGAEALQDPTRPLVGAEGARPPTQAASAPRPPRLQMTLVAHSRGYAVIDGQILVVGQQFRGARLVQIRKDEVLLKTRKGLRRMKLASPVQDTPAPPDAATDFAQ